MRTICEVGSVEGMWLLTWRGQELRDYVCQSIVVRVMPNFFILYRRDVRFMPSLVAAPDAPPTTHRHSSSVRRIRSRWASSGVGGLGAWELIVSLTGVALAASVMRCNKDWHFS